MRALLLFPVFITTALATARTECRFATRPTVVLEEPQKLLQWWEQPQDSTLETAVLPSAPSLDRFRRVVRERVGDVSPLGLLRRQLALAADPSAPDTQNLRLVLEGKAGRIAPMRCLEGLLFALQADRLPMEETPTEMSAFVLRRGQRRKIYFYTVDQPGIGGLSDFTPLLARDRRKGWTLDYHLHNHNFFLEKPNVMGGIAPSAQDVRYYRGSHQEHGLAGARVTNGFDTLHLTHDEFARLAVPR